MTASHTPGPWSTSDGYIVALGATDDGNVVCAQPDSYMDASLARWDANAHLIAAAPELLDSARKNLSTMEWQRNRMQQWGKSTAELDIAIDDTRVLIARATGAPTP